MKNRVTVFYYIKDDYINRIKKLSINVPDNKEVSRPYIGVLIQSSRYQYFVPLMSPKPKHLKMKNAIDFMKIDKGHLGVLNFNNMIPVTDENLVFLKIKDIRDPFYKNLLFAQRAWILENEKGIISKATNIYQKFKENKLPTKVRLRCVNFTAIENYLDQECYSKIQINKSKRKGLGR